MFEFYDNHNSRQTLETQKYIGAIKPESTAKSVGFISDYWNNYKKPSDFEKNRHNYVISIVNSDTEYRNSLIDILAFLNSLQHCTTEGICHSEMVTRYYRSLFLSAVATHHAWLEKQRNLTNHPDFYLRLECFVRTEIKNYKPKRDLATECLN